MAELLLSLLYFVGLVVFGAAIGSHAGVVDLGFIDDLIDHVDSVIEVVDDVVDHVDDVANHVDEVIEEEE